MLDDLGGKVEDAAQTIWESARKVLALLAVAGWSGIWAVLLLIGLIGGFATLMQVSGGVLLATLAAVLTTRYVRKRRLERAAQTSLIARAKLEGLKLDRNLQDVLRAFDMSYNHARAALTEETMVDDALRSSALRDLERVREHLHQVVVAKVRVLRDLRRLGSHSQIDVVRQTADEARRTVAEHQRTAERIMGDAHHLCERLADLRRLSPGPLDQGASESELRDVLSDLDRTATAYRELDDLENDTERRLRAARAMRKTTQ